jgi:hypothetical protein
MNMKKLLSILLIIGFIVSGDSLHAKSAWNGQYHDNVSNQDVTVSIS